MPQVPSARAVQAAASTGLHGGHQVQTMPDLEELGGDATALPADLAAQTARHQAIERCASSAGDVCAARCPVLPRCARRRRR